MLTRILLVIALLTAGCSTASSPSGGSSSASPPEVTETTSPPEAARTPVDSDGNEIPPAPPVPAGPLPAGAVTAVDAIWDGFDSGIDVTTTIDPAHLAAMGTSGDVRLGWLLSDLMRFFGGQAGNAALDAFVEITGAEIPLALDATEWRIITDYLIAWDVPAPPGYAGYKERLYTVVEPGWAPFFADDAADVDWRFITWGGVLIDDRPLGEPEPCFRCIPALDDPPVTDAAGGSWYPDTSVVFGVTLNGESRAYPKNIMEVHEMVNDTLGGRRIGMPYCTLCGSAQAFLTGVVPDGFDTLVLRTSGLLSRSNKVMYDVANQSMFDTFLGVALTGPLREAGFELEPVTVVTTTWGDWKEAHPATTIVAEDGGRGYPYPDDPLQGRDLAGPIFPVGDVDARLPVQEQILGVVAPDGTAIAFPAAAARLALEQGTAVGAVGVSLLLDGGGLRAVDEAGNDLATHQAFWFAWSQFRPETEVWAP